MSKIAKLARTISDRKMASSRHQAQRRYSKDNIEEKFQQLKKDVPELEDCASPIIAVILDEVGQRKLIKKFIDDGVSDIWLPLNERTIPHHLSPSAHQNFLEEQNNFLEEAPNLESTEHCHLTKAHLANDHPTLPKSLEFSAYLGEGGYGYVYEVCNESGKKYALKKILRPQTFREAKETMKFITMELNVLRRIHHHHFVQLVGSYTDEKHVGLLMSPVADYNLSDYLDEIQITRATQNLMATFFGCLAGALTALHYSYHIRHKDIKPKNILIKGQNILLTDFGMALDWNESGQTTTNQEQRRSPKYCAPETAEGESRNSKADIWSLGCVFLEIVTVLKGQNRKSMKDFFNSNGSRSDFFRLNQDAVVGWIRKLKEKELRCGNLPLEWTEKMLQRQPPDRPNARELMDFILDSKKEDGMTFWGDCCGGDGLNHNTDDFHLSDRAETSGSLTQTAVTRYVESVTIEDEGAVQELLYEGFDKHGFDFRRPGRNGLHWAVRNGKTAAVRLLLQNGVNFKIRDETKERWTVLHIAADKGHTDVLRVLLEHISVDEKSLSGWTALHCAVKNGNPEAADILLKHGADANAAEGSGWTSLHCAAENGFEEVAQLLLDNRATIDAESHSGMTPLHKAAVHGWYSIANLLLKHGAVVDRKGYHMRTALHMATIAGHPQIARRLIEEGFDIDAKDETGITPLQMAAAQGHREVVQLLLNKNAQINLTNDFGQTALFQAVVNRHGPIVQLLVERGADRNKGNLHGWTPLHMAIDGGYDEFVGQLLDGANLELQSGDGRTILHTAAENGNTSVTKLLLDSGANIEAKDWKGWTPLHWAAHMGKSDVTELLLERGANKDAKNHTGQTPFQCAEGGERKALPGPPKGKQSAKENDGPDAEWSDTDGSSTLPAADADRPDTPPATDVDGPDTLPAGYVFVDVPATDPDTNAPTAIAPVTPPNGGLQGQVIGRMLWEGRSPYFLRGKF